VLRPGLQALVRRLEPGVIDDLPVARPRASGKRSSSRVNPVSALDRNAIGGLLMDLFRTDMTDAAATCATCGAVGPVAGTVVYLNVPGNVVRYRSCLGMLMVISRIRGVYCADLTGVTALESAEK
jgi:Family of unknown function (DUF6510)